MCLAIPGKIVAIQDSGLVAKMATVDFGGIKKDICIEWIDATIGEYILAHAGVALCKVDEKEAEITLNELSAIAEKLDEYDKK